jgi:hypothetical protein
MTFGLSSCRRCRICRIRIDENGCSISVDLSACMLIGERWSSSAPLQSATVRLQQPSAEFQGVLSGPQRRIVRLYLISQQPTQLLLGRVPPRDQTISPTASSPVLRASVPGGAPSARQDAERAAWESISCQGQKKPTQIVFQEGQIGSNLRFDDFWSLPILCWNTSANHYYGLDMVVDCDQNSNV